MGEVDRLTAEVAGIARQSLREVAAVRRAAHRATAHRSGDGWLARLAGNRSIPDRAVSLADPDARPIRKGKPRGFGFVPQTRAADPSEQDFFTGN